MDQEYLDNDEAIRKLVDTVMEDLHSENFQTAFDVLKPYWPFPEAELEKLHKDTVEKIPLAKSRFGETIGYSHVKTAKIGDFIHRYFYVLRFEKHVLRMMFTFYQGSHGWLMNGFTWDDTLEDLFES